MEALTILFLTMLVMIIYLYQPSIHKYEDGWYLEYTSSDLVREHIKIF